MKLLRQVARQPLSLHKEIIIVDDFSTDGTREFLRDIDLQEAARGQTARTPSSWCCTRKTWAKAQAFAPAWQQCQRRAGADPGCRPGIRSSRLSRC